MTFIRCLSDCSTGDTAGIIIRQQARRIDELERDVVRLRNKLDKEVGPNPASAEA